MAPTSHRRLRLTLLAAGAGAVLALAPAALAQYEYPDTPGGGTGAPNISIGNASALEGNAGMKEVNFTISLSMASATPVSVRFEAVSWPGGTAGAGDFHGLSGVVVFAPGEMTKTTTGAHAIGDTRDERNESFFVHLSEPVGATIAQHHGTGTIRDDDPPCTIMGTAGPNVLRGTAGRDVICGLGGNDTIVGRGGNDVLLGGAGADTLIARDGARDVVNGGAGTDRARVDRIDIRRSIERRF